MNFKNANRKPLLKEHLKSLNDRYAFFTEKKTRNDFVDIEVSLKDNTIVKNILVIKHGDLITYLKKRIIEVLDRYHKFSGLTGLTVKNMKKRQDGRMQEIPENGLVKDYLKSGDKLTFEIENSEIWLEINMTFLSEDDEWHSGFEMKISVENSLNDLKYYLISFGIKLWAENTNEDHYFKTEEIYSLLTDFSLQLSFIVDSNEKIKNIFTFESKLKCVLHFRNLNELAYKHVVAQGSSLHQNLSRESCFISSVKNSFRTTTVFHLDRSYLHHFISQLLADYKAKHPESTYYTVFWRYQANKTEQFFDFERSQSVNVSRRASVEESLSNPSPKKVKINPVKVQRKMPFFYSFVFKSHDKNRYAEQLKNFEVTELIENCCTISFSDMLSPYYFHNVRNLTVEDGSDSSLPQKKAQVSKRLRRLSTGSRDSISNCTSEQYNIEFKLLVLIFIILLFYLLY